MKLFSNLPVDFKLCLFYMCTFLTEPIMFCRCEPRVHPDLQSREPRWESCFVLMASPSCAAQRLSMRAAATLYFTHKSLKTDTEL